MGKNQAPQLHDWRIVRENLHADGLLQVQRCHRCDADRTIWTPQDEPPQVLTTRPAQLPPDCPQAPRQRRPQATTAAERSGAALRAKRGRQQDLLILLFAVGTIIVVMLVLTRTAHIARRAATQEIIETALFHIDDAVTIEAIARSTRNEAVQAARAAVTAGAIARKTHEAARATTEAAEADYETIRSTAEAALATLEAAAAIAYNAYGTPAWATAEAALATLEAAHTPNSAARATHSAAFFDNELPPLATRAAAATIEAAALETLETASQDHEAAAAIVTAAVTYEAQILATIEAQKVLPWWYWLLQQR